MTSMPDLPTATRGASWPVPAVQARPVNSHARTAPPTLEPEVATESTRAEARRMAADRQELDTQTRTAESLKDALATTSRDVRPQVVDLRRLYERPRPTEAEESRALDEQKLAAAGQVAQRLRMAAARVAAMRIAQQEKAARAAEDVQADAERLADINRELQADRPPRDARRADLLTRQKKLVDGLVEATGATPRENADGSVDLSVKGRSLVEGGHAEALHVPRSLAVTTSTTQTSPPPSASPESSTSQPAPPTAGDAGSSTPAPGDATPDSVPGVQPTGSPGPVGAAPAEDTTGLEVRWSDGSAAAVGGRLGGYVAADRTLLRPAAEGLDRVAMAIADDVNTAQASGRTEAGAPGPTLLTGSSAWDLRLVAGATASDVAAGAPMPAADAASVDEAEVSVGTTGGTPVSAGPGATGTSLSPEDALAGLEEQVSAATTALGRRAGVVGAFDMALGVASERIGQNVSAALGAVGDVSSKNLVAALHQANASMAFAGAAARQAIPTGIPVLVGSSDPSVATASGVAPVQGAVGEVLQVDVISVAGQTPGGPAGPAIPGMPGQGTGGLDPGADAVPSATGGVATATDGPASGLPGDALGGPAAGMAAASTAGPGGASAAAPDALIGGVTWGVAPGVATAVPPGAPGVVGLAGSAGVPGPGVTSPGPIPGSGATPVTGTVTDVTTPGGVVTASAGPAAGGTALSGAPASPAAGGTAARTVALVGGSEFTSASTVLSGVRPGLDIAVNGPGRVTLAITPDPGPALARVQSMVDAVGAVATVMGSSGAPAALPTFGADPAAASSGPAGVAKSALSSVWSSVSSFASALSGPADVTGQSEISQVLGAVASPLVAAVGEAFVDPAGRPLIPGTSANRGRIGLDREVFAREYVKDAVGVEGAIASVAKAVASTSDAASDPRIGALAVRIQSELAPQGEYTIDEAATDQRLDARRNDLDRRAGALQSLLEHLEDQSGWLASHLR